MIDLLTIGLTHALLLLGIWRLLGREDLDCDPGAGDDVAPSRLAPTPIHLPTIVPALHPSQDKSDA